MSRPWVFVFSLLFMADYSWARGRVVRVDGRVESGPSATHFEAVSVGDRIDVGSVIRTGADGAARLLMEDDSVLNIGPNSELEVKRYQLSEKRRRVTLRLTAGRLWARVTRIFGGRKNFEVETQNAVAGVRGTEFVVDTQSGETVVTVLSGEVSMKGRRGPPVTLLPNAEGRATRRGRARRVILEPEAARSALTESGPSGRLTGGNRSERVDNAAQTLEARDGDRGEGGLRSRPVSNEPGPGPSGPDDGDAGLSGAPSGSAEDSARDGRGAAGDSPSGRSAGPSTDTAKPNAPTDPAGGASGNAPARKPPARRVAPQPVRPPPATIPGGTLGAAGSNAVDPGIRATRVRVQVRVRGQ